MFTIFKPQHYLKNKLHRFISIFSKKEDFSAAANIVDSVLSYFVRVGVFAEYSITYYNGPRHFLIIFKLVGEIEDILIEIKIH